MAAPKPAPAQRELAEGRSDSGHVVRAGESLWSIAQDRLGGNASPAAVAAYVARLWKLNASRIGTGDPGLVKAGTKLAIPER